MALLSIENLSIRFNTAASPPVVNGLHLHIDAGESLGLVGESGSGKSVTAMSVLGLLGPAAHVTGAIRFTAPDAMTSVDLLTLSPEPLRRIRGLAIGMVFQEPMTSLNPVMPVGAQIAETIRAHHPRQTRSQLRDATIEAMQAVALPDPARRMRDYPHQFSGGQRQRILIAMAIVNRPQLLIADEPTTALDVTVQAQILDLLDSLRERYNLAMLFISHDLAVVSRVAHRIAVMRHGLLLEQGPSAAIFLSPLHAYTRSLLGAIPTLATPLHQPLAAIAASAASIPTSAEQLIEAQPGHWVRR